jgi:hypothetical protein
MRDVGTNVYRSLTPSIGRDAKMLGASRRSSSSVRAVALKFVVTRGVHALLLLVPPTGDEPACVG